MAREIVARYDGDTRVSWVPAHERYAEKLATLRYKRSPILWAISIRFKAATRKTGNYPMKKSSISD